MRARGDTVWPVQKLREAVILAPMDPIRLYAVEPPGARLLELPPGATGCHDAFRGLPQGVYSGLRTYGGSRFLRLEAHLDRTQQSIDRMGWSFVLDRDAIADALVVICADGRGQDQKIRFDFLPEPAAELDTDSRVLCAVEPLRGVPAAFLAEGVGVGVADGLERSDPIVKKSEFTVRRAPLPLSTQQEYEHLLLDSEGRILEGSSSNTFGVRAGELVTAGDGVLEGITRAIVLELAEALGMSIRFERLPLDRVGELDEMFLSSSARHVVPIVSVAGRTIGTGEPGPATRALMQAYDAYARENARPPHER